MRPLRLDLAGFTVFREPTTVDFTDADFFALVGPTGSGKSTVLDAICFALYGTVPRWGDRRGIANALAPSAAEARVRLVFESAGARYVGHPRGPPRRQGNVKTSDAGLELMPPGFDVARLDTGTEPPSDLGEVLAGTPAEMDQAVRGGGRAAVRAVHQLRAAAAGPVRRLPARQAGRAGSRSWSTCSACGVYEEVQKRANGPGHAGRGAAGRDRPDAGRSRGRRRRGAGRQPSAQLAAMRRARRGRRTGALPALRASPGRAADEAAAAAGHARRRAGRAGRGPRPGRRDRGGRRGGEPPEARPARPPHAVATAEEREEKLRGELAAAGDRHALRPAAGRARRARPPGRPRRPRSPRRWPRPRPSTPGAPAALDAARAAAHARRRGARGGPARRTASAEPPTGPRRCGRTSRRATTCPVCEQTVDAVPAVPTQLGGAPRPRRPGRRPAAAADAAQQRVPAAGRGRPRPRTGAGPRPRPARPARRPARRAGRRAGRLARRRRRCAGDLDAMARCSSALDEAGAGRAHRPRGAAPGAAGAARAEERLRAAWREFDTARDAVARFGPPAGRPRRPGRGLAHAGRLGRRRSAAPRRRPALTRPPRRAPRTAARRERAEAARARCSPRPVRAPRRGRADATRPVRAAAVAVERAEAARSRLVERREQAGAAARAAGRARARRARSPRPWPGTCGPTTSSAGCWRRRWTRWSTAPRGSCASCPPGSTTWSTTRASSSSSTTTTPGCAGRCAPCPAARRSRPRWPSRSPCPSSSPALSTAGGEPGVDRAGRGLRHAGRGHPGRGRRHAGEPGRPRRPDGRRGHPRAGAGRTDPGPVRGAQGRAHRPRDRVGL